MDLENFNFKILTDHEIICLFKSTKSYLVKSKVNEHDLLKDLLLFLESEISNRNLNKE